MIDISFPSVTLSGIVISVHSNVAELWWDWIKRILMVSLTVLIRESRLEKKEKVDEWRILKTAEHVKSSWFPGE